MPSALGELIKEQDTIVGPRPLARQGHLAAADQPYVGDGLVGARNGRGVATVVRRPVRPATRSMRVVSRAAAGNVRQWAHRRRGSAGRAQVT
jgi:hypothetical protein